MSVRRTAAAQARVADVLKPGEFAIDATLGNGHDTVFLAGCVGPRGTVWSFDVQSQALVQARIALAGTSRDARGEVVLIEASHADMAHHIPPTQHGRIGAVMFNLGYLPGGDKTVTTLAASTLRAVEGASDLLRPGGVMTVVGYVGHTAGRDEVDALLGWMATDDQSLAWTEHDKGAAPATAPRLFVGVKTPA